MGRIIKWLMIRLYTCLCRQRFAHWGKGAHIAWKPMRLKGLKYVSVGEGSFIDTGVQLTAWDSHNGNRYTLNSHWQPLYHT